MNFLRKIHKKHRKTDINNSLRKINIIEKFVESNVILFDTKKYHVAMLDNFWNIYTGKKLINFCDNLIFYCKMKNAHQDLTEASLEHPTLLISLKDENNEVKPFCIYKNKELKYL